MTPSKARVFVFKIAVTVAVLGLLIYSVDASAMVAEVKRVSWGVLAVAAFWYVAATLVSTFRWSILLRAQHIVLPFFTLVRYNLSYTFYSIVLPGGKVTAEGVRVYQVLKDTHDESVRSKIIFPTLLDRAVVVFVAAAISTIFFIAIGFSTFKELPAWFPYAGVALVLALTMSAFLPIERFIGRALGSASETKQSSLSSLKEALRVYRTKPWRLVATVALTGMMLAMLALALMTVAAAFEASVSFWLMLGVVSTSMMAAFLPLTIGGVGIREGTFAYLFATVAHVPPETALAISLVGLVASHIVTLMGGGVEFRRHFIRHTS